MLIYFSLCFVLTTWFSLVVSKAFFYHLGHKSEHEKPFEDGFERFQYTDKYKPEDEVHITLTPTLEYIDSIDFEKGWGQQDTPDRRRRTTTLTFEEFNAKHFPQYLSTPNWDDYGTYPFTNAPNISLKDNLKKFLQYTAHSFEVEQYFREFKRRTWFSEYETWELEAWRGWTTTVFPADLMVYNKNSTWLDLDELAKRDYGAKSLTHDFDYRSDEEMKQMIRLQQGETIDFDRKHSVNSTKYF